MEDRSGLFNKLVGKISDNIPPLPRTIELLNSLDIEKTTSSEIAKIIEMDQAIVSKILKLANSAYYGVGQRIQTISFAIVCLGFNKIKSLVFTAHSQKTLNQDLEAYKLTNEKLFEHSIAVAIGARIISEKTGIGKPEDSYTMGLLHDIGKIILNINAKQELERVWAVYAKGSNKMFQVEKDVFGFTHADIGEQIAKKWNFPESLTNAIGYHHEPDRCKTHNPGAYVVYLANGIAKTLDVGNGIAQEQNVKLEMDGIFQERILKEMKLSKEQILEIRTYILDRIKQIISEIKEQ